MNLWRTTSVDETPVIELICWRVWELPDGDRHFNGYNVTEYEGRASSKIIEYDAQTGIGTTRSGRQYKLLGPTGYGNDIVAAGDAAYVWTGWCKINRVVPEEAKDV